MIPSLFKNDRSLKILKESLRIKNGSLAILTMRKIEKYKKRELRTFRKSKNKS
jgi:hypothetical protein